MAGETEVGRGVAPACIEVLDAGFATFAARSLEGHPPARKSEVRQDTLKRIHGSGVDRGNRGALDKVAGEGDRVNTRNGKVAWRWTAHGKVL